MDLGRDNRQSSDGRPLVGRRAANSGCERRAAGDRGSAPERRPLLDDALSWIVRLKSGEATEADLEGLRRWRDESPLHDEAFRDAARIWRHVGVAARELAEDAQAERDAAPHVTSGRRWSWRSALFSLRSSLEALSAADSAGRGRRRR
jgi:transmembrane sensor